MSKYFPRVFVFCLFAGIVLWMTFFLITYFEKKATVEKSLTLYQELVDEAREHSARVEGWYEDPETVQLFVEKLEKIDVSSGPLQFQEIFKRNLAVWRKIKGLNPIKDILDVAEELAMTDSEHFYLENQRAEVLVELKRSNEELHEFGEKCGVNMDKIILTVTPLRFSTRIKPLEK